MAGSGSRFSAEGYGLPKPFVDINGRMMIERVLTGLELSGAETYLVVQEAFLEQNRDHMNRIAEHFSVETITVKKLTQGASCTALAAFDVINNNEAVVFADSDNLFYGSTFRDFLEDSMLRRLDAAVATFGSNNPAFSYIEIGRDGLGIRTREKEVISSHAIAGLYFFARGQDFIRCAIDTMIYGDRMHNEYYMSNTLNYLLERGGSVGHYPIESKSWDCVGTPSQLNEYLKKTTNKSGTAG
jgi:dTDP-glucose pyrophosphorylase